MSSIHVQSHDDVDYRHALRRLSVRCPDAIREEPLLQRLVDDDLDNIQELRSLLQRLIVNPAYTLPTTTICRPVLLAILSPLIDAVVGHRNEDDAAIRHHQQLEIDLGNALVRIWILAPYIEQYVSFFPLLSSLAMHARVQ